MRQTKTQGSALTPVLYLPDFVAISIAISIATFIAVLVPIAVFIAVFLVVISGQITTYCGRVCAWSDAGVFLKNANRHEKSPETGVSGDKSYRF